MKTLGNEQRNNVLRNTIIGLSLTVWAPESTIFGSSLLSFPCFSFSFITLSFPMILLPFIFIRLHSLFLSFLHCLFLFLSIYMFISLFQLSNPSFFSSPSSTSLSLYPFFIYFPHPLSFQIFFDFVYNFLHVHLHT